MRGDSHPPDVADDCTDWYLLATQHERRAQLLHANGVVAFHVNQLLRRQYAVAGQPCRIDPIMHKPKQDVE